MRRQAGIGRLDDEFTNARSRHFADFGGARNGDFIHAVDAVHDPGFRGAQFAERLRHRAHPVRRVDAKYLVLRASGVGQRTKQVEDRPYTQLLPDRCDMAHGAVVDAGEHEADAGSVYAGAQRVFVDFEIDAERLQHVGGAGLRRDGPVAMLGHAAASCRDDDGAGGRGVEAFPGEAPGAAGVQQGAADFDFARMPPHDARAGDEFAGCFAAHGKPHQQRARFLGGGLACQQGVKGKFEQVDRQGLAPCDRLQASGERAFGHAGICDRKFWRRAWPCSVRMLSGWNCTP